MTPIDFLLIAILVVMFVVATKWPINIGILGLVGSFLIGTFVLGMDDKEILKEFPASIVLTIVGVTFFFSLAQRNGTIDYLVQGIIKAVGGHTAIVPWVFFLVGAGLTAMGTFSPAAVALLAPAAMAFSARTGFSAVVTGALVINGAHAGGFSPISVSGVIVRQIAEKQHMPLDAGALFWASFAINLIVSVLTVVIMSVTGRLRTDPEPPATSSPAVDGGAGGVATRTRTQTQERTQLTPRMILTMVLIVAMIIAAVGFGLPIGFVGLTAGLILSFTMFKDADRFVSGISWSTVLLVSGMMVYISLMTESGVIDNLSHAALAIGAPLVVALVLCYVIGVGSAFASSTALITAFIPLSIPLLQQSDLSPTAVMAALAVSATIVDVSPFSTDGALIIAATIGKSKDKIWRQLLIYAGFVVALAPLLAWVLLVPTGIM